MAIIQKAKETMTARERTLRTFNREKTDRVTIGYEANAGIHARLSRELGIMDGDMEQVFQALGVDYRPVPLSYAGPRLFTAPANRSVNPLEGSVMRWVEHETGGYWDFCDFPLLNAEEEAFERFPIPNPDHFDYDLAVDYVKARGDYALYVGNAGMPDIINSNGRIMGMEDVLCHLALNNEAAISFIRRRADMYLSVLERTLERCRGMVDFMWLGEDLGTQIAPMVSLNLVREHIRPIHQRFVDLAKAHNLPVLVHSCGSSSWAYEDFIEMGIDGVDTLQPEAVNMSPAYLKRRFGGRLSFRGCISTAGPLAYGTTEDVEDICRDTLSIMMEGYGYHFAPTHAIQDNSPVENVIAMYNAAHTFGVYR